MFFIEFFDLFVEKVKPVHIKGVYKHSAAVNSWTNDYLINHPDAKTTMLQVEPSVIENRTASQKTTSFYEFLKTYQKEPIHTFGVIPKYL